MSHPPAPAFLPRPARPLILASASPYRAAQLKALGLNFEIHPSLWDEEDLQDQGDPEALAVGRSQGKAREVAGRWPDALVLGGDQLVHLHGQILGKPGSVAAARQQLTHMAGQVHQLITATTLRHQASGWEETRVLIHLMHMRGPEQGLDAEAIAAYVAADSPLDCAGSYRVEAQGASLFVEMEGKDHTAIVGLPVTAVVSLLASAREVVER